MRTPCCHTFLAFILKFLNFLQTFFGLSIIIYSVYMLNQWNNHSVVPPASAPSPEYSDTLLWNFDIVRVYDRVTPLNFATEMVSGVDNGLKLALPAPWFIYAFMSLGVLLCCISCIGHIAAEAINECCLCFYTLLKVVLILLEAALVAFIAIDTQWEKDLPFDPTGELDGLRAFVEDNIDVCKWVGIIVVIIQLPSLFFPEVQSYLASDILVLGLASYFSEHWNGETIFSNQTTGPKCTMVLSLFITMILRAMVSTQRKKHDIEEDYDVSGRTREPLLNSQLNQTSGSIKGDTRGAHSDIWGSRMREKYGLRGGTDASNSSLDQSTTVNSRSKQ